MGKELKKTGNWHLGYMYSSSNDGAFSRNYQSEPVTVYIAHRSEPPLTCPRQFEAGRARTSAEADSVARGYVRTHNLRAELAKLAEQDALQHTEHTDSQEGPTGP